VLSKGVWPGCIISCFYHFQYTLLVHSSLIFCYIVCVVIIWALTTTYAFCNWHYCLVANS
jgi:hypothetical protein